MGDKLPTSTGAQGRIFFHQQYDYPFSHNHGSVENDPKWKETHIGDTPIFPLNHD